ncbi:NAD(P)-dependent oxidoreductase [Paenibacillus zeisoli]|uniref:NAD(P)-dependent oxidoreductase n=1 Tax=Paenibacillus zeisoli TaxID=2496267 RepID=A0A433XGT6_9BACL|nr:NAD(P)-dependent oxidoreductase [Paenibacillus zeisoli]RUT33266.1 NAD(P)-dependent oxidoreductase [Paenibacillus zeisoli]
MRTTVIGGNGFIGRSIIHSLKEMGEEYYSPSRHDTSIFSESLGHVIYCAGVTSDFRQRPFDTVRAHVVHLTDLLEKADFESFLYLSSTRVYFHQSGDLLGDEDMSLQVNPNLPEDLFTLSKLTGESLCLTVNRPNVRIARISNVCGNDFDSNNFIYSIIKEAVDDSIITLQTALDSEKDYISLSDVVKLLIRISRTGESKVYNIASGVNIPHRVWVDEISSKTGCLVKVNPEAKTVKFPPINNQKIRSEFQFVPKDVISLLPNLINAYSSMKR